MLIIDIPAKEIQLGDILGEGMQVWMIVIYYHHKQLSIQWGPNGASLIAGEYRDKAHRIDYKFDDIIRVIRG